MQEDRLTRQIRFILELDRLKAVLRRTYVCSGARLENSAEHSWHVALAAMLLAEHADEVVDAAHAAKMMLIHDIVEIDAGDVFLYDRSAEAQQHEREKAAADRIYALLPDDQAREWRQLWEEFEAQKTPEARLAKAVDRLLPLLHNFAAEGKTWREHGITQQQALECNAEIGAASEALWSYARKLIAEAAERGFLARG